MKRSGTSAQEKLSSEGVQNPLRALKAFFSWLHVQGPPRNTGCLGKENIRVQKKVVDIP